MYEGARDEQDPSRILDLNPHRIGNRLRLFLTDNYPEHLAVWRGILTEFEQQHGGVQIEVTTVGDPGYDILRTPLAADVLQVPLTFLRTLGSERFLPVEDLAVFGLSPAVLAPPMAELARASAPLAGVPFEMTCPVFLVNETGLKGIGGAEFRPTSVVAAMEFIDRLMDEAAAGGYAGFCPRGLFRLLVHAGAFVLSKEGRYRYCRRSAMQLSAILSRMWGRGTAVAASEHVRFEEGNVLLSVAFLFVGMDLCRVPRFDWSMQCLPTDGDARSEILPIVLGIRKDSPVLPVGIALCRFLCGRAQQVRLGRSGGSLPARSDALFDRSVLDRCPLPESDIRRLMETGTAMMEEESANLRLEHEIDGLGDGLAVLPLLEDEILAKLELSVERYERAKGVGSSAGGGSEMGNAL